jgi:integral membrane protein
VSTRFGRYRVMAYVTGTVLLIACFVALPLTYAADAPAFGKVVWTLHGWLYLLYLMAAVHLAMDRRWKPVRLVLVLLAGTIPFLSFVMERRLSQEQELSRKPQRQP